MIKCASGNIKFEMYEKMQSLVHFLCTYSFRHRESVSVCKIQQLICINIKSQD